MELQALMLGKKIRASAGGKYRGEKRYHLRGSNADAFCMPGLLQRLTGLGSAQADGLWRAQAGHSPAAAAS